jgi:hypothetical protein
MSRAKTFWGNSDPPRRDFGELIRLFVVLARHVVELYPVELVLEGTHGLAVRLHLVVVTARVLHDPRVTPHVEALDACFDGDFEATKEGLVLSHVV